MAISPSLNDLWGPARPSDRIFDGGGEFPEPVRRYLSHAIQPGTALATAVRLRMHGDIKLDRWRPFSGEQVIAIPRGSMWCASARLYGLPVTGFDRYVDGQAEMRWKLLGIMPLMVAAGPDITRSATGRMAGESMWLPSWLATPDVRWYADDRSHVLATLPVAATTTLRLAIGAHGEVVSSAMERWGNPNGQPFANYPFGCAVEAERTFGHYTIPSRIRAGWFFGTPRFDAEGEFFRCTIDAAEFR